MCKKTCKFLASKGIVNKPLEDYMDAYHTDFMGVVFPKDEVTAESQFGFDMLDKWALKGHFFVVERGQKVFVAKGSAQFLKLMLFIRDFSSQRHFPSIEKNKFWQDQLDYNKAFQIFSRPMNNYHAYLKALKDYTEETERGRKQREQVLAFEPFDGLRSVKKNNFGVKVDPHASDSEKVKFIEDTFIITHHDHGSITSIDEVYYVDLFYRWRLAEKMKLIA